MGTYVEGMKNKIERSNGTVFQSRDFEQKNKDTSKIQKIVGTKRTGV